MDIASQRRHCIIISVCVAYMAILVLCVLVSLKGWDQTSKVIKIYITSISELSQASKEDVRGKFKDK